MTWASTTSTSTTTTAASSTSLDNQFKIDAILAATANQLHVTTTPIHVKVSQSESERVRRLCIRIRMTPCVYLKCLPERKRDERFALAAMLGLNQTTHRRDEVLSAVAFHCPSLFANSNAMFELFLHGDIHGVEDIITRMCTNIAWDRDLAMVALHRTPLTYRYLPKFLQTDDRIIQKLLENPSGGLYLGRCAPRALLIARTSLVLRAMRCGLSRSDVPLELLMSKEFILQAVAVDSFILTECSLGMISDWDVLMAASTSDHNHSLSLVEASLRKCRINPRRVLAPFAEHVKSTLDRHFAFQTFLNGVSVVRPGAPIPLQVLNCGEETSTALKRQIAEYIGDIPSAKDIDRFQKAWDTQVSNYYYTSVKAPDGTILTTNYYNYDPEDDVDCLLPISRFLRWGGGLTLEGQDNVPRRRRSSGGSSGDGSRRVNRRIRLFRHVQVALGIEKAVVDRESDSSDDSDTEDEQQEERQVSGARRRS